jgi:hypothetical protein
MAARDAGVARRYKGGRRDATAFEISTPRKFNENRHHKIPAARHRVTNWPEVAAAVIGCPGQTRYGSLAAGSQTVNTKSITGASGVANSSHGLNRSPSADNPRDDQQRVPGQLGRLRQRLREGELGFEAAGRQIALVVKLARIGHPFVHEHEAGTLLEIYGPTSLRHGLCLAGHLLSGPLSSAPRLFLLPANN